MMQKSYLVLMCICLFSGIIHADKKAYTFKDLVETAFKNNHSIERAHLDRMKADAVLKEARSAVIPDVSFTSTVARYNNFSGGGVDHSYSWGVQAVQPLYTGGKTWIAYDIARKSGDIADYAMAKSQEDVIFSIVQAYYGILKTQKMVAVSEEALTLVKEHKRIAEANIRAGVAVKSDLLRVEVREANLESALINTKAAVKKACENLFFVLGTRLADDFYLVDGDETVNAVDIRANIEEALKNRYDVKLMEEKLAISKKTLELAKADKKPTVAAFANSTKTDVEFPPNARTWQAGAKMDWLLFDGGYVQGKIDEAKADFKKEERNYEELVDGVKLRLETARLDLESSLSSIEMNKKSVELAKENLRLTESRFRSGLVSSVVVLDDEVALTEAKTNYLSALYDYKTAAAKLYLEMGKIMDIDLLKK